MTLVVPNAAEAIWLDAVTGKAAATTWTLRLYTAIGTAISNATVVGDITEAVGGGYAAIPLTAGNWSTTLGSPTVSTYPKQTFAFTGPLTTNPDVLGYYITRADGSLVVIEAKSTAFTPTSPGDSLDITPRLTLASQITD